jgi:lipoprotein NlpI
MRVAVLVPLVAVGLFAIGLALAPSPRAAAQSADWNNCQGNDRERRIAGCTAIIDGRGSTKSARGVAYNNRGLAYRDMGDLERALNDFNEAVDLDGKNPSAHYNRGEVYRAKGDLDRAAVEFSEAMRLDGKDADPLIARGIVYRVKGDNDRALADLNEAIRLNPKSEAAYFNRGLTYLYSGALPLALADLGQAADLDPKDAYTALWVDIVAQRSKAPSPLPQAVARIDMNAWPAPIVRLFLGEMALPAALAAAGDADARKARDRACEANFYGGQWALRQTKRDAKKEAARLFTLAASDCPPSFNEASAAKAELKALGTVR